MIISEKIFSPIFLGERHVPTTHVFGRHLTILRATLVSIFLKYAYTERCHKNGDFVRYKPTGK